MSRFERNKRAVERYVTILQPKLERQTGGMISMQELGVPESEPPITDTALELIYHPSNIHTSQVLEPILRDMGLDFESPFKGYMLKLLGVAGLRHGDPGAVRRWRAGETEDDRLLAQFFERSLAWVAQELERRHPGIEIRVEMDPDWEEARAKTREAHDKERTYNKEYSYRLIGAEIAKVMEEEECNITAAKGLVSQRTSKKLGTPCSFWRVHDAWLFWSKEQAEDRESA